ncbi:uncharacterized protein LOC126774244 isoform X1 [Nymphalis io]|uniref:uncharacterized protein LOC126774244 isoform X1 n=1 Tax=Inachis io TaxID=171585 RepID=UPI002168A1B3|nr:uncharacterized protein LOC126774244 isoform X1 [Nymphalis io]
MDLGYFLFPLVLLTYVQTDIENEEPILYYYGLESSERGLPACAARQACSALLRRYWRAGALLRLCRCARRLRCDAALPPARRLQVNDRVHLQFCNPVGDWPECAIDETPLSLRTSSERMDPDELERLHHRGVRLTPPKIMLKCRCRYPTYWKFNREENDTMYYQCASLPPCKSGDFCGNVDYDLLSLYQSCLCPRNHICVHNGGTTHLQVSELLYRGKGWRAYCQPISDDYDYDEY